MFFFNIIVNRYCGFNFLACRLIIILVFVCLPVSLNAQSSPTLQLANVYHTEIDVKDYWVSEKLDGVRAYWDGHQFFSKNGNVYVAPAWFTQNMPDYALDGELWISRNTFDELSGIVRKKIPIDLEWRKVSYQVFDLPQNPAIFDVRLNTLNRLFGDDSVESKKIETSRLPEWLSVIKQFKVNSHAELMVELDRHMKQGSEGLMLHLGASRYHGRRDDDLLKLKQYFDAEATVIEHYLGKGKYSGILGSIQVETLGHEHKKIRFRIGTGFSVEERKEPPAIGAVITYKYFGFTKSGLPKFPSFLRIRRE
jgi:DNA ligase-1